MNGLTFLKLGGSLITDKHRPSTPRQDVLARLANEIARARRARPELDLVLGHGSGSFGHTAAKEYHTREGLAPASPSRRAPVGAGSPRPYWRGFAEVWHQASALNRLVMDALHEAGVPAIALAPVAAVRAEDGKVLRWDLGQLKAALEAGLVPVIYGDVVFDTQRGGTILSTEDLFEHLARELRPARILLAGLEAGVWEDFPERKVLAGRITPDSFEEIHSGVGGSQGVDVTGGMESKVRQMLTLVQQIPGLAVQIFSGEVPDNIERALQGEGLGTLIMVDLDHGST
jgi:isopentenyl phosphate kinase